MLTPEYFYESVPLRIRCSISCVRHSVLQWQRHSDCTLNGIYYGGR